MRALTWCAVFTAFVAHGLAQAAGQSTERPNIVFILADDLGWRDVGYMGSTFHRTPHIDALAARGMTFSQAYTANPLCSPTRASILTGQYPARLGITAPVCHQPEVALRPVVRQRARADWKSLIVSSATRLDTRLVTLAEVLRAAGYATGHFGKWHLGREPYSPLEQGFDVDVPHWPGPGPAGSYVAPWRFPQELEFRGAPNEHVEDRMADEAAAFIRANREQPFYLNYWAFSVHGPWDAKLDYVEERLAHADLSAPQHNALYAAMVRSLDDAVGKLVAALEENGVLEKTLIVFFSDNGGVNWTGVKYTDRLPSAWREQLADVPPTSNAPLRGGKASLYEGGTRVPCIVSWPGHVQRGARSDALIQSIDFFPTLVELTGAELPENQVMDGRSMVALWRGETTSHREAVFNYFPHNTPASGQLPAASVRYGDWKLIRLLHEGADQGPRYELYNLAEDLSETTNLAETHPEIVQRLDGMIEAFLQDTNALVPGRNPAWKGAEAQAVKSEARSRQ